MPLQRHLARCEADTRLYVNPGAATMLARWQEYQTEEELVQFIRRLIRGPRRRQNGWEIDRQGGVSLESIVLDHEPEFFDDEDKKIATETLGR